MTDRGNYSNNEKNSRCELKDSKRVVSVSEAFITEDDLKLCKPKTRPPVPTVKDIILIPKQPNVKPLIPTINETVQCNQISSRKQDIDTKFNESFQEQSSDNKMKVTETRLFIDKKKKERAEKNKIDLFEKKKFLEDKKRRLDQLRKTTRELVKTKKSKKPKIIPVDIENKSDKILPVETNRSKSEMKTIDQTWSPPSTLPKSFKKAPKTPINIQTKLENSYCTHKNRHFDVSKTVTKSISNHTYSISQSSLVEKNSHLREVAKPENIYCKLKLNESSLLTTDSIYDHLRPKIIHVDTPLVHKDHNNVKLNEEMSHSNESVNSEIISLNVKTSNINPQQTNFTNVCSKTPTDLRLPDEYDKKICYFNGSKEFFSDNCFPNKMCSESTQTDSYFNCLLVSSDFSSPMNLNSILECKNSLPLGEKDNPKLNTPVGNSNINGISISKNLIENNISNVDSTLLIMPDEEYCDEKAQVSNFNFNENENYENTNKALFIDGNINSSVNTYDDIKRIMEKINCDLEFFTKNSSSNHTSDVINCEHLQFGNISNSNLDLFLKKNYSHTYDTRCQESIEIGQNNSLNSPSSCLPKIHDEFQAELDMLDQLNDSLHSIEKMDCDSSIKNNKRSIFDELNGLNSSNDLDLKTIFNSSHSNNLQTHCSKLNSLSSGMVSVDKTITNFSILMFEQLIKDEELRAKQHLTINSLREKSLVNRLTWEATMCDLQATFRNLKNPLGNLHEFQMFKQQHRGRLKKLENSLSQVKRLGKVIDSVYKRRIIMLEEHLQYLRMQSSSKKVIRKLNSLDHVFKKEENVSHLFNKQCKTNSVDIVENKTVHEKCSEPSISLENNTFSTVFQTDKPKIVLQNQATSPINAETDNFKLVDNQVQTDTENFYIDKFVQTSKTSFNCSDNYIKNRKLSDPIDDLSYQNELLDININNSNAKRTTSIISTNPVKVMRCSSESSISTNSEQGEIDARITTLQEQLEARKRESSTLKKKQKKLKLESLKAKEQDILKQIEMYDKKIEESRRSLMVEIEKKSIQVKNNSIKHDSSSKQSTTFTPEQHSQNKSNKIKSNNNCCVPQDKLTCELQQKSTVELKENHIRYTNNDINSEMSNNCKQRSHFLLSLETNQPSGVALLHTKAIAMEIDSVRKSNTIQSNEDIVSLNSQSEDILKIHSINDCENNLILKNCLSKINEVSNTCDGSDKSTHTEKFTTCYENINNDRLHTNSSTNSTLQQIHLIDSNKNINAVSEEINCDVSQLEASNNETLARSVDDKCPDFTSDGSSPESRELYKIIVNSDNMINIHNTDQDNESSYEEDRSEGDVMFEDNTFIEQYPSGHDPSQDEKLEDNDKVDVITNNIFSSLIEDMKNTININKRKPLSSMANIELNNLTEETPLLMILKREEEHQNMIILSEKVKSMSDVLFKHNLQQIVCESLQMYLPKLNKIEVERLKIYLNWISNRKKTKLPQHLKYQYKTTSVDSDESFENFYQEHKKQKTSPIFRDEISGPTLVQQKAENSKLERSSVKGAIELPRMTEESQFFLREIPNKPPPPYKSPTKKKALDDMPYTPDEVRTIVLTAADQLFRDPQSLASKDCMNNLDSKLHVDYKTLIFDYCKEIAQDMFFEEKKVPLWKKPKKKLKQFRGRPKCPEELFDEVIKKLNQIESEDVDDCEEKVNAFVIKQMYEEDSKWVDFQLDEMNVLNDVVHSLINKLIYDTVKNIETNCCLKFM